MGSVSGAGWVALALCGLCGCGARVGLDREQYLPPDLDSGLDDRPVPLDGAVDRTLSRPPPLEAGCDGAALPSPRSVRSVAAPTRLSPMVLHDPTRQRALVLGGLPVGGRSTREVYAVSTRDGQARPLGSSPVELGIFTGLAWIDPPRTAIVVGGSFLGGMWTPRVLRVQVDDDALQFATAGEHPGGPCTGVTAVFDPGRGAVVVHGGRGIDTADPQPFATTWRVRLDGATTRWEVLVPAAQSPPAASARVAGVDPRTGAVVMLGGSNPDGLDRSVWSLSPGDRPVWTRLDGAADVLPRSGDALPWDPVGCGFLVVGGRCAEQVWLVRPEPTGVREALLGTMRADPMTAGLGRIGAGVVFDPGLRSLVMIAGSTCQVSGGTVATNAVVDLR